MFSMRCFVAAALDSAVFAFATSDCKEILISKVNAHRKETDTDLEECI